MKFRLLAAAFATLLAAPLPVSAQTAKTDRVYGGCWVADAFGPKYFHTRLVELIVEPFVMDPAGYMMSNHYFRSQKALSVQWEAYLTSKGIETYGLGCKVLETREKIEEWNAAMIDQEVVRGGLADVLITDWVPKAPVGKLQ